MDRPRCVACRNPIKEHQPAVGPTPGERTFHEDCWNLAQTRAVEGRQEEQRDYESRIASDGLAALLSPYVSTMPEQRLGAPEVAEAAPEPVAEPPAGPVIPEPTKPVGV